LLFCRDFDISISTPSLLQNIIVFIPSGQRGGFRWVVSVGRVGQRHDALFLMCVCVCIINARVSVVLFFFK